MGSQMHLMSLTELLNQYTTGKIHLWVHNRDINNMRAKRLADAITSSRNIGPVPIIIADCQDGKQYVLDGQHRLAASRYVPTVIADTLQVWVSTTICADEEQVRKLFRIVNSGLPVPPKFYDEDLLRIATRTSELIILRWPLAISDKKPQRPRFTQKILIDSFCSDAYHKLLRNGHLTPENIIKYIIEINEGVKELYNTNPITAHSKYGTKKNPTLIYRAEKIDFFAGLNVTWSDDVATLITRAALIEEKDAEAEDEIMY